MLKENPATSRPVRRFLRRKLDMRIRILTAPSSEEFIHGRCITIGEGGFGAILTQELPERNEVWVEFRGSKLLHTGQIRAEVRQRHGFHYGFQFLSPNQQEKSLIRQLVAGASSPD